MEGEWAEDENDREWVKLKKPPQNPGFPVFPEAKALDGKLASASPATQQVIKVFNNFTEAPAESALIPFPWPTSSLTLRLTPRTIHRSRFNRSSSTFHRACNRIWKTSRALTLPPGGRTSKSTRSIMISKSSRKSWSWSLGLGFLCLGSQRGHTHRAPPDRPPDRDPVQLQNRRSCHRHPQSRPETLC